MNLYLVSRTGRIGYDEYDAFVVAAPDEDAARNTYPNEHSNWDDDWGAWVGQSGVDSLEVQHIGTTDMPVGVVLASFRAG